MCLLCGHTTWLSFRKLDLRSTAVRSFITRHSYARPDEFCVSDTLYGSFIARNNCVDKCIRRICGACTITNSIWCFQHHYGEKTPKTCQADAFLLKLAKCWTQFFFSLHPCSPYGFRKLPKYILWSSEEKGKFLRFLLGSRSFHIHDLQSWRRDGVPLNCSCTKIRFRHDAKDQMSTKTLCSHLSGFIVQMYTKSTNATRFRCSTQITCVCF